MNIDKLIDSLKRDSKAVLSSVKEINNKLIATKPTKIYIPARFADRSLAFVGTDTFIAGFFAMSIDDKVYATNIVCAMVQIEPTSFRNVTYKDEDYIEFFFEAGSTIIPTLDLVKNDVFTYYIYDELISKGNVPWYMNYVDLANMFNTAKQHANANIGEHREITEVIVSLIARDSKDKNKYYCETAKSLNDLITNPPAYIAMKSVIYAATNTLNKIAGSYMGDGIISALVNPTDNVSHVEELLRA